MKTGVGTLSLSTADYCCIRFIHPHSLSTAHRYECTVHHTTTP